MSGLLNKLKSLQPIVQTKKRSTGNTTRVARVKKEQLVKPDFLDSRLRRLVKQTINEDIFDVSELFYYISKAVTDTIKNNEFLSSLEHDAKVKFITGDNTLVRLFVVTGPNQREVTIVANFTVGGHVFVNLFYNDMKLYRFSKSPSGNKTTDIARYQDNNDTSDSV